MDSRTTISLLVATSLHAAAFAALDAAWLHSWTTPKSLMRDCLVELEEVAPDKPAIPLPMALASAPVSVRPAEPPPSPPVAELTPPPEPKPTPTLVASPKLKPAPAPQLKAEPPPVAAPTLESKPRPVAPPVTAPMRVATAAPQSPTTATPATSSSPGVSNGTSLGTSPAPPADGRGPNPTPATPAAYLSNPEPVYPAQSRRRKEEGTVLLGVEVSSEGRALRVEIDQGSGHALLDEAALKAVRRWRFEPARLGNRPVNSHVQVPIRFRLDQ